MLSNKKLSWIAALSVSLVLGSFSRLAFADEAPQEKRNKVLVYKESKKPGEAATVFVNNRLVGVLASNPVVTEICTNKFTLDFEGHKEDGGRFAVKSKEYAVNEDIYLKLSEVSGNDFSVEQVSKEVAQAEIGNRGGFKRVIDRNWLTLQC